jgi:hypothetical protein
MVIDNAITCLQVDHDTLTAAAAGMRADHER